MFRKRNKFIVIALGMVFIGLGVFSLNRPMVSLGILVIGFGVTSIIRGIANITGIGAYGNPKSRRMRVYIGGVDILIGFLLVTNLVKGAFWLGLIFSVWFLVESIGNLFLTVQFSYKSGVSKFGILFLDIACVITALLIIFNPSVMTLSLPFLVGISSILYGVVQVIQGAQVP